MKAYELTTGEVEIINEAIKNILDCEVWHTVVRNTGDRDYMRPEDWFQQYKIERYDVRATCGSTKLVFLVENLDNWVIKVPFLFSYNNAPGRGEILNYCEAEAQIYQVACECNKAHYFAPCYYYTTENNIPFYIQKRVECDEELNSDVFFQYFLNSYDKENYANEDELYEEVSCDVEYMSDEDRLYAIFGFEDGDDLLTFLEAQEVNDIHAGNFGYFNQMPILIDYSGY